MNIPRFYLQAAGRSLSELLHPPRQTIGSLDLLRTIAISLVLCGHVNSDYLRHFSGAWFNKIPVFTYGWTGVDLFFVLSGFLIGKQLWKELASTGNVRFLRFFARRGFRIWPLYYCFLLLLIFFLRPDKAMNYELWRDFLFLTNYKIGLVSGGWSLSTEEQFYIVVPVLFILLLKRVDFRFHGLLILAIFTALPAVRWVVIENSTGNVSDLIYTPIHTHCDGLVIGLALAWAAVVKPQWYQKRRVWVNLTILFFGSVAAMAIRTVNEDVFSFSSLGIIFGACVFCSLTDNSLYSHVVARWKVFHVASRLSFGVYLVHFEILPHVTEWVSALGSSGVASFFLMMLGCFVLSFCAALVGYALIEFPFLALRSRWLRG